MAITINEFFKSASGKTSLELIAGNRGMDRIIHEPAIHRPGLALAGFFQHFACRRVQVIGMAEHDYLASLSRARRYAALRGLFNHHIPCLVICRNRKPCPEIIAISRACRVPVFRSPMITGTFINTATVIMENLFAPTLTVQGTMIDIMGIGVLIEGCPGIGKSEAALALIVRGYSLVADDFVILRRHDDRTIVAASAPVTRYHMELRGLGIIHVPSLFGVASVRDEKTLDLIVTLRKVNELEDQGLGMVPASRNVLGVELPHVTIPVAPGRELANIIEVASMNEKLKRLGHDAAKELDEKLMAVLAKGNRLT
ncbi:MAG: HPr(Ser) kinase/phosphatase [Kiritimatiellae bacterium]|nr:HPr(Ser) kinase/phosphatase [Kiritimatiellia bacterium]